MVLPFSLEHQGVGRDGKGSSLAVDLHTVLLSNQRDGEIKAEARFVRKSRGIIVVRTRITGNEGRLLAEVTSTHCSQLLVNLGLGCLLVPEIPPTPLKR